MSRNASLFNKTPNSRYMSNQMANNCDRDDQDICVNPPIGQPKCLTLLAPVVFDEVGINLCRVCQRSAFANPNIQSIRCRVIDIDFNMGRCEAGSKVEILRSRPSCCRVTLSNICCKIAITCLDACHNIIDSFVINENYLPPCEDDPSFDEETNPTSCCVELYAPYGLSYTADSQPTPTINFCGMEETSACGQGNNGLRQGLCAQALCKVVRFDPEDGLVALGLTIYLKTVYFVQYRVPHEGLAIPPKAAPAVDQCDACHEFVEGDLLELNLQPLENSMSGNFNPADPNTNLDATMSGSGCGGTVADPYFSPNGNGCNCGMNRRTYR